MSDITDFVSMDGNEPLTDSRRVAAHFGKLHKNVLQSYDDLDCSSEFNELNFQPVEYSDAKGELRRQVLMTKDGFMFLVMGFSGREAAAKKEAFIRAFNDMAERLRDHAKNLWAEIHELERQEVASFARASLGSRLMLEQKKNILAFEKKRLMLDRKTNPPLKGLFDDDDDDDGGKVVNMNPPGKS